MEKQATAGMEKQAAAGDASAAMTAQSAFRALHLRALPPLALALLLLGIIFLLRIFYASYVWTDEGLWFTAAQELPLQLAARACMNQLMPRRLDF